MSSPEWHFCCDGVPTVIYSKSTSTISDKDIASSDSRNCTEVSASDLLENLNKMFPLCSRMQQR